MSGRLRPDAEEKPRLSGERPQTLGVSLKRCPALWEEDMKPGAAQGVCANHTLILLIYRLERN
jgi:hypothetical protein